MIVQQDNNTCVVYDADWLIPSLETGNCYGMTRLEAQRAIRTNHKLKQLTSSRPCIQRRSARSTADPFLRYGIEQCGAQRCLRLAVNDGHLAPTRLFGTKELGKASCRQQPKMLSRAPPNTSYTKCPHDSTTATRLSPKQPRMPRITSTLVDPWDSPSCSQQGLGRRARSTYDAF